MESFDLNDIWRLLNNNTMQFALHSSRKPYIFSRLDYFLVSSSIVNSVCDCTIIPGFKSDHSIVTMNIHLTSEQRGPGYFKINNSLLLQDNYQEKIRNAIRETAEINSSANPNALWEVIKGTIRNESIQYATRNKKENKDQENKLIKDINNIQQNISNGNNTQENNNLLKDKKNKLEEINEKNVNGHIVRARAEYIEGGEKNTKFFANLEKKRSTAKTITRLNKNDKEIINPKHILKELESYYAQLYKDQK